MVITPRHRGPASVSARLDDFLRLELIELFAAHPQQIAEHFARMLPEDRWRQLIFDRRFRESHRARDRRAGHARWVRNFDFQSAVLHLRILEYLPVIIDRTARNV